MATQVAQLLNQVSSPPSPVLGVGVTWVTGLDTRASKLHNEARAKFSLHQAPAVGVDVALTELITTASTGTQDSHGGYLAYAPTGGLYAAALANFACSAMNRGLTWLPTSPELAALEQAAIDWIVSDVCRWSEDAQGGGVFTSGGSVANALGLHVARVGAASRVRCVGRDELSEADAVYYVTDEVHYCISKALRVLGVPSSRVRKVPSTAEPVHGSIDAAALDAELAGLDSKTPVVLVATAGTTSSGAVDDIRGLVEVREAHAARGAGCWLHVDGCFGGFFMLTSRGRDGKLGGMCLRAVDSVALDPHKALQLPYGTGALVVRHSHTHLTGAFRQSGHYCPPANGADGTDCVAAHVPSISDMSLELSREARGAQVWLLVRSYGAEAFASHLNWCLDAAAWIAESVRARSDELVLLTPPNLSVINLTFKERRHSSKVDVEEMILWLTAEVNAMGRVLVAPTQVSGRACLRLCVLSSSTTPQHLSFLLEDILEAERRVAALATRLEGARANPNRRLGFLVPYEVEARPGRGLCVVARRDLAEGEPVWRFEPGSCLPVDEPTLMAMRAEKSAAFVADYLNHCFPWSGELLYPQGDTQFFNHSPRPSIRPAGDGVTWVATRHIAKGAEITDDYGTYDNGALHWYEDACVQFATESAKDVSSKYASEWEHVT